MHTHSTPLAAPTQSPDEIAWNAATGFFEAWVNGRCIDSTAPSITDAEHSITAWQVCREAELACGDCTSLLVDEVDSTADAMRIIRQVAGPASFAILTSAVLDDLHRDRRSLLVTQPLILYVHSSAFQLYETRADGGIGMLRVSIRVRPDAVDVLEAASVA